MSGALAPRCTRSSRQPHHLAEAMVHHREPAVGAEHAQAVRHVVQRGVELARQRRFAFARQQRLYENGMQAEIDVLESDEEQHQQRGEADIVRTAVHGQRHRHRAAGEQDMELDDLRPAIVPGSAAGGVADRQRRAEHVRDGIVAAEQHDETPNAERGRIQHRADPVSGLPLLGLRRGQHRRALFVFAASGMRGTCRSRRSAPRTARSSTLPVFSAVISAADGGANRAVQASARNSGTCESTSAA